MKQPHFLLIFADFSCEEVKEYIMSKRGRPLLVDQNGYVYINRCQKSKDENRNSWRCRLKHTCSANVITYHNVIIKRSGIHTHLP